MFIENKYEMALNRDGRKVIRSLGVKNITDYQPHTVKWSDLAGHRKAVLKVSRDNIDEIKRDEERGSSENLPHQEALHDALMAVLDEIDTEISARDEVGNRNPRPQGGSNRRPNGRDMTVRGDGTVVRDGSELETVGLRSEQRMAEYIADRGVDDFELTPGAYMRAMVLGAKTDVEKRALSEGTDSAGGYTVPEILSAQVIDLVRAQSTVMQAGALTVPLQTDTQHIAKVASDPVPAWRNEAAAVAEGDPTFTRVTFTPRSLAVLVKVSRELLEDSLNMETLLPQIMTSAMAVELDRVALFGSGTAPEPQGVVNFTGVQEVAHDAALASYAPFISARTKIKTANHAGVDAYILHPRDEGELAGLTATDGQPLNMPPAIADVPMLTSTSVPDDEGAGSNESTIITGKFNQLMVGLRHGVTIQILRERFQDTGQYGFVAFMRADIAAAHENAFCKITGIVPA